MLLTRLAPTRDTLGAISHFDAAIPGLKIKSVLPLPGLASTTFPWIAVSIVGPVNQLQIVNPEAGTPIHVLNIPASHNGGIESMTWHKDSRTLYLSTGGTLLSWKATSPKKLHKIGKVAGASTLYELHLDSTGTLWGGTYPTGTVFSYVAQTNKIRVHTRVAPDTDYVRCLAIGPDDQIWAGTGSQNPRLFTFSAKQPNLRTEIQLPHPTPDGFISSIDVLGNRVAVAASSVQSVLFLDPETRTWAGESDRVWTYRLASTEVPGTGVTYNMTEGNLYATDTSTWQDTLLGSVGTKEPLSLFSTANHIVVASQIAAGLRLEYFNLVSRSVDMVHEVTLRRGEFTVHSIMAHSDGNIYMGGFMGQGLAAINPDTGARWSSPHDEELINQVEGMIEFDSTRTYLGSYGGADIVSLAHRAKDAPDGYVRLARLGHSYHQSRPYAWAVNSRNVFFGTVPDYGLAGGVLGNIDPTTNKISWVLDGGGSGFIRAHSIVGLAADESYVYGTSSTRNGYGIPDTKGPGKVFKLDIAKKKKIWETTPILSTGALYAPKLIAGWLVVADIEGINIIDPVNGKLVRRHRLTTASNADHRAGWANADIALAGHGSQVVHSAAGTTTVVDFRAGTKATIGSPKSEQQFGNRLAATQKGRVFGYTDKTVLVELDLVPRAVPRASMRPKPTRSK